MRSPPPPGGAAAARTGLIVTADDFGLHPAVNEAVGLGHERGILTAASLMVGAPAAAEAVMLARHRPSLRVGLHVVLADGAAVLPRWQIPDLVDAAGRFRPHMAWEGVRFFFLPAVRRQLEAEIHAQFVAFAATGLPLDHVNAHKHFHLHPTVLSLIVRIGRQYGLRSIRVPADPEGPVLLRPWVARLARRLDRAGIFHNDRSVGLKHSGAMDETALVSALRNLPPGLTEIYLHPATESGRVIAESMPDYHHADELAALLSPAARAALQSRPIALGGFADFREN